MRNLAATAVEKRRSGVNSNEEGGAVKSNYAINQGTVSDLTLSSLKQSPAQFLTFLYVWNYHTYIPSILAAIPCCG